ncbi:hypothetical protein [Pelosinus sp. UFO1]|uniref:hypothetical protein n=1 Tax=Pelosinus sp. UFO1 TaxID=484770 RepID=UPI0004D1B8D2|nr:hypothetical protein [Pelosinus sp. UFO1]AIF51218.1 hypothetical protein UFO1_1667 [Pelosinus sp. UFO1]
MSTQKENATIGNSDDREIRTCPSCSKEYSSGNFCSYCGQKVVEECDCWKLNRRFNCGHNECPTTGALISKFGYELFPSQVG